MKNKILFPVITFIGIFFLHLSYFMWRGIRISAQWIQVEPINWFTKYFVQQDYLLGLSYALAGSFAVYSLLTFMENKKSGIKGFVAGVGVTGVLYWGGCFLIGCCGSPMLAVYLSLFGATFLGFIKPLAFLLTMASVAVGYWWMKRGAMTYCLSDKKCNCKGDAAVPVKEDLQQIKSELQSGMNLAKCRKCGCMKEALESLEKTGALTTEVSDWLKQMEPIEYSCLGCKHCFGAVAQNAVHQSFPETAKLSSAGCGFETNSQTWPFVPGDYIATCHGADCPVAVTTLASVDLAEKLAHRKPKELCIVGKTETENIGIDKLIKNVITNRTIRVLVVAGLDTEGHYSGQTILSLYKNGVDENMKVIGSKGRRSVLTNVTRDEIAVFRKQVKVVDMIGCQDANVIIKKIQEVSKELGSTCSCLVCDDSSAPANLPLTENIQARGFSKVTMDKAGYFVIMPQASTGTIVVEHYSYDNKLQRTIDGKEAAIIYGTIIENGWVTQLSHAAYLGKELARAEFSLKHGFKYIQEGAG